MNQHPESVRSKRTGRLYKMIAVLFAALAGAMFVTSAKKVSADGEAAADYRPYLVKYRRPTDIPFPKDNEFNKDRELLGRTLFFDPRLSDSQWISCATCHNPGFAWGDGLPKGIGTGMRQLDRRTPTILNLAWAEPLFWDGRAATLEEQALGPIESPGEMNLPLDAMVKRLNGIAGYRALFQKAYPNEGIKKETVAKAIATFERTVVSGNAPFDEWIAGNEQAIPEEAKRGFMLFNTKANCAQCHNSWRFTDDGFHDIGLPGSDIGRGNLYKDIEVNQHAFKAPTLRNIEHRAPYMHDGSKTTLEDVVDFYNDGGKVKRPSLSPEMKPLNLTPDEKKDIIAFLKTLTSTDQAVQIPVLPR